MKIIADENIAQVADYFGWAGELITLPGRAIDAAVVHDADVLLVRSITRVDAGLLKGSRCRFVGTATSGVDHVDSAYLRQAGIGFGWARGCNANAVVEYVFSVLASLSMQHGFDWRRRSVGVAGCGEIGARLATKMLALRMPVRIHDPLLSPDHPLAEYFSPLDEVLAQDILSFHTPLTKDGRWPTWHLLDEERLAQLSPAALVINTSRGGVVDNDALLARLQRHPQQLVVLDAWEGEPEISLDLLRHVAIGTPHIAGYSREGKLLGTQMIAADFCKYFSLSLPRPVPARGIETSVPLHANPDQPSLVRLNSLIRQAYDVMSDHRNMQELLTAAKPGACFDVLRKTYPVRPAFTDCVASAAELQPEVAAQARILGFRVQP